MNPSAIRPIIRMKDFVLGVQTGEEGTNCDQEEQEPKEGQEEPKEGQEAQ